MPPLLDFLQHMFIRRRLNMQQGQIETLQANIQALAGRFQALAARRDALQATIQGVLGTEGPKLSTVGQRVVQAQQYLPGLAAWVEQQHGRVDTVTSATGPLAALRASVRASIDHAKLVLYEDMSFLGPGSTEYDFCRLTELIDHPIGDIMARLTGIFANKTLLQSLEDLWNDRGEWFDKLSQIGNELRIYVPWMGSMVSVRAILAGIVNGVSMLPAMDQILATQLGSIGGASGAVQARDFAAEFYKRLASRLGSGMVKKLLVAVGDKVKDKLDMVALALYTYRARLTQKATLIKYWIRYDELSWALWYLHMVPGDMKLCNKFLFTTLKSLLRPNSPPPTIDTTQGWSSDYVGGAFPVPADVYQAYVNGTEYQIKLQAVTGAGTEWTIGTVKPPARASLQNLFHKLADKVCPIEIGGVAVPGELAGLDVAGVTSRQA